MRQATDTHTQAQEVMTRLRHKAREHPPELKRAWFNDTQFQCSSQFLSDYLDEAERNLHKLLQTAPESPVYAELASRVEQQLQALAQALYQ